MERLCLHCHEPLKGRIDKKFCDDYCRNNYNNNMRSDQIRLIRKINSRLKKNRNIMQELLPESEEFVKVKREKLIDEGFKFNYHTHTYTTLKNQTYIFCYEYGYLPLENDFVLIVKRAEKE